MQIFKLCGGAFLAGGYLFSALGSAQTIAIVSGNGQAVCPDCAGGPYSFAPLVVQVNDSSGSPVTNTLVTWTVNQQGAAQTSATSTTDTAGQAGFSFTGIAPFFNVLSASVVASALDTSVSFVETTLAPGASGAPPVVVSLIPAGPPPALTGFAGQTDPTPIQVGVFGPVGPLPGVQVRLQSGASGASVSCATQPGQQAGTVLTDVTGTAACMAVFGSEIGTGTYTIVVGGNLTTLPAAALTVTRGMPSLIKIISGNNQSVDPGVTAPLPLTAEVTDLGGNPSSLVAVTWSVTAGAATLSQEVDTSSASGLVSARVTPAAGPVQVVVALASDSSVQATFAVTVNSMISALQIVSGGNQETAVNTPFPDPLIVLASDDGQPVSGATVSFTVTSGPATLSASTAVTDAQGQAQVTATAGATAGAVVVTASAMYGGATYSQVFQLSVGPPGPVITSVVNSAGFQNQFVSPCSLATIYGTGLAPGLQGVAAAFIEPQTQVAGVTVQFGGVSAPILYVANVSGVESVSVQVPCEVPASAAVPPATVPVVVSVNSVPSTPFAVTVLPFSPGIFQFADSDGRTRAVLIRPDGSFVSLQNPARRGDIIRMFVTGLGQTTPGLFTNEFDPLVPDASGDLVAQILPVNAHVIVGVNNGGVLVVSAKYAYGMVGVYEVDFQVPEDTAPGNDAPLAIVVYQDTNALVFGNPSLIPIQ